MAARFALLSLLALAACTDSIVMRNPETGETADCGNHYSAGLLYGITAPKRDRACVEDYQRQGWIRTGR